MDEQQRADIWVWVAEHDGRINAWWKEQRAFNARLEAEAGRMSKRVWALEKKVFWFAGWAAGLGAAGGTLLTQFFIGGG